MNDGHDDLPLGEDVGRDLQGRSVPRGPARRVAVVGALAMAVLLAAGITVAVRSAAGGGGTVTLKSAPPGQPCAAPAPPASIPLPPGVTLPTSPRAPGPSEGSGGRSPFPFPTGLAPEGDPGPARSLAASLLKRALLPASSRTTTSSNPAVQGPPEAPATPNLVDAGSVFAVPVGAQDAVAFLAAHPAPGTICDGTGSTGSLSDPIDFFAESLASMPAGIASAELLEQVVPNGPGSSLVRLDAEVVFDPTRTRAETVGPSERVAVITRLNGPLGPSGTRMVTVTDPSTVQRLAQQVNDLPTVAPGASSCPAISTTYRLSFARSVGSAPDLVFDATGCGAVTVTVHGILQPSLSDAGLTPTLAGFFAG